MKKEVKREIDFSLDKDMKDILERNARQGWLEYNLSREERIRKTKIKERVLAIVVGAFIIVATATILILNSKLMNNAKESCMSSGHSENYCMERL
jgi:hypothetical protein